MMNVHSFQTPTFLPKPVPVDLVGDVLATSFDGRSLTLTCELLRHRPQLYDSYGTLYENIYLPVEYTDNATIRIDVCTEEIFRVRFSPGSSVPDNTLNDRPGNTPMVVNEFSHAVKVHHQEDLGEVVLSTSSVQLVIAKNPYHLRLYRQDQRQLGREIFATRSLKPDIDLPDLGFDFDPSWNFYHRYAYPLGVSRTDSEDLQVFESFHLDTREHIFGLGESYLRLDKHGRRHDLWVEEVYSNTSIGAYKRIPYFASTRGYGLFLNSSYPLTIHLGDMTGIAGSLLVHGTQCLDYYLIYGPELKRILSRYTDITGKPGLPPKWTFGHWMSRLTYRSQREVERTATDLRSHCIPTDVIHIDTGWFAEDANCDLTFCQDRFPDPAGMKRTLGEQGFHLSVWQWPNMLVGNKLYEEAKAKGFLVKRSDGQPYHQAGFMNDAGLLDYSHQDMRTWIQEKLHGLFREGVDVIKVDFGEGAPVDGLYAGYEGKVMHNLYPLLYNQAIFEATEAYFGKGQSAIWARSAWAGSQRYPIHWSGDGMAMWQDLACTLRAGLSLGLSGFSFWSHDIGGFVGRPSSELYARWVQLGMFSSHSRAHGAPPREPWHYGDRTEAIYRDFTTLRYRLMPYIYSQAVEATQRSLPMMRALVLDYQDDPNVATIEDQYLFGDDLLIAPILSPVNQRDVYLPQGTWVDFWSKEVIEGGGWMHIETPLEQMPMWVRAGAILPMGPVQQFVDEQPLDPLSVTLYAPGEAGHCIIHDPQFPDIVISYQRDGERICLHSDPTPGDLEVILYGASVATARCGHNLLAIDSLSDGGTAICLSGHKANEIILELAEVSEEGSYLPCPTQNKSR